MFAIVFLFIGTTEVVIISLVVLLFFGGKKIPEMMKGLGKGVKEFNDAKNSITGVLDDDSTKDQQDT